MSDNIEAIVKDYEYKVLVPHYPRSIGLFPIPEYPELEPKRGMWSAALDALLTTLRYLAPATLLTLFWGHQSFLFKFLKHIDSAFRAIVFSSEEQKQEVLLWLSETGPVKVDHLDTVWSHGWIVCSVLDTALPGACAGHPPTELTLKHAQAIADHYLGVEPVFSRQELECSDALSRHQEWKLATYLDRIRQSLAKLTPPVSKPASQRTSPETTHFTLDYVAKGSGLAAAQVNSKSSFKIYPTSQQSLDPGEITILIRGPKDTYGMSVLPPILGKAQLIRQKLLGLQAKPNYTENVLPITQGATYLRAYGKNDMNKTYHIPKTAYDIDIEAEARADHTKIYYIVNLEGKYIISITSRGQSIVGSPFNTTASNNIISILEQESFCLEDGEEIDIVDIKTDRKVVLRIVDFVTEKMLLKENGSLEKISEDEAKILMSTDQINYESEFLGDTSFTQEDITTQDYIAQNAKFCNIVNKVILLNRVTKTFQNMETDSKKRKHEKCYIRPRSQQDIPDIVNSTLPETNNYPFKSVEARKKYIVPENISVSLTTEKPCEKETTISRVSEYITSKDDLFESSRNTNEDEFLKDMAVQPRNPFFVSRHDIGSSKNDFNTYVTTEYETNNSQYEETPESQIKILIDENITPSPTDNNNPFIDPFFVEPERPKTPVLKIISGDIKDRDDSVYVDPETEKLNEEFLGNEFINPFFMHQQQHSHKNNGSLPTTDFIIGAPVSLPPIIRASTPEPNLKSIATVKNEDNIAPVPTVHQLSEECILDNSAEDSKSVFSTPLHTNMTVAHDLKYSANSAASSTFHSFDSNFTDSIEITNSNPPEIYESNRNLTPRKDTWDSAYVSIDDNSSSPDSNNNDNIQSSETVSKHKFSPSDNSYEIKPEELVNMGPAERELWKSCNDLNHIFQLPEEVKSSKWEIKRPLFTPIIEESDRSISAGNKDITSIETSQLQTFVDDPVTVAFAELNDVYHDYYSNSETDSTATFNEDNKFQILEVDYTIDSYECVDSASEISDVKRQTNETEGEISEVQANVTESDSASQTLRDKNDTYPDNNSEIQFGDLSPSNLVLERKKYWDDRIRQIEAKTKEAAILQRKRRLSSKHLRHNDSLTKRRGKQIAKKFLSAGDTEQITKTLKNKVDEITNKESSDTSDELETNVKLVDKWKKYWNEKFESENSDTDANCFKAKSPKRNNTSVSLQHINNFKTDENQENSKLKTSTLPVKQELPEEVYKAFETSPKRFFGTSRKQILSKIDTFLGKPSTVDNSLTDVTGACHDSGLVSSRITLFHSISHTEELPRTRQKSKSLHNIYVDKHLSLEESTGFAEGISDISLENNKLDTNFIATVEQTLINDKRRRISCGIFNKSFDDTVYKNEAIHSEALNKTLIKNIVKPDNGGKNEIAKQIVPKINMELRRKSFSKSEMDIFNKATINQPDDGLEKYKSCDELPKTNVKSFITLFESVSKTSVESIPVVRKLRNSNTGPQKSSTRNSSQIRESGEVSKPSNNIFANEDHKLRKETSLSNQWSTIDSGSITSLNTDCKTKADSLEVEIIQNEEEKTFSSLSDIDIEIVERNNPESSQEHSLESSPDPETVQKDYKARFKMAKQYFQSLEELRQINKPRKLNECELLLRNKSEESPENLPQKRIRKIIKSHSVPSSEISKAWNELQNQSDNDENSSKLVKISEKFNVDDLFTDVTEGKLSRQGSLRGIPHKKAVLEAFRSMENLTAKSVSPYEIAVSQLNDFAKENQIKNAQTYLSEYPYLPTTDPSKYHSRVDTKASGLISLKEILNNKPRRNSVPDLRLNPTFTVKL